jgi:hypothetical protein
MSKTTIVQPSFSSAERRIFFFQLCLVGLLLLGAPYAMSFPLAPYETASDPHREARKNVIVFGLACGCLSILAGIGVSFVQEPRWTNSRMAAQISAVLLVLAIAWLAYPFWANGRLEVESLGPEQPPWPDPKNCFPLAWFGGAWVLVAFFYYFLLLSCLVVFGAFFLESILRRRRLHYCKILLLFLWLCIMIVMITAFGGILWFDEFG